MHAFSFFDKETFKILTNMQPVESSEAPETDKTSDSMVCMVVKLKIKSFKKNRAFYIQMECSPTTDMF